ncbi:aldo/keto reductase [Rhodoplanes azumiensis]|uniref:Aldo/keto reductase n=1 Tax=Rhodoplanes azumiensis TaxID=1897628 RepID=A0ABW5AEN3_9BRAD
MEYVTANGATIPAIGLGTWELKGRICARTVEQALRSGYKLIDTAEVYENEREVGEGIRGSGLRRAEVFVTTKIWPDHLAPRELERATKGSLARLRLSEVDLLLIHWPNPRIPLSETIGALCKMKQVGFAKNIGVSNFTVALLDEAVKHASEPLAVNQIEWHPHLDQSKVVEACRRHGMAVTAFSPMARGAVFSDQVMREIAAAHGKTPAQVSLRYIMQAGGIPIPRAARLDLLTENLAVFDFVLGDDEMAAIRGLARPNGRIVNWSGAPKWD